MDPRCTLTLAIVATALVCVSSRAVNISNTWMLPEEGFPVFYRYFRDRISWYEADAVCQFHHANLVTVDSTSEYDAVRAYLKELDIANNVWIGLSRNNDKAHFAWTDFRPLSNDGHWQEAIPIGSNPLCVATDPAADFRWHAFPCGGPEIAAFICELPVPAWANGPKGCLLTELPSLTVLYVPEQSALELTSDCGLDGTKRIVCKGNADHDDMMRHLSCGITNDDFDEKATKGSLLTSTITESTNPSQNIKTTKSWIWTSNTIDTGDYGAPTRHRRETENTISPSFSTKGTTDLTMREHSLKHQETSTDPSIFIKETKLNKANFATTSSISDVTLDLSINQKFDRASDFVTANHEVATSGQSEDMEMVTMATPNPNKNDQDDNGELSGVINQGQLFSIIENGTIFDIIELNDTGTEDTNKESSSTQPPITELPSSTKPFKTFYTTIMYFKEPTEIHIDKANSNDKEGVRGATPKFETYDPKPSMNEKKFTKHNTRNDLQIENKGLNKEVAMLPILSDSSVKLNRTYRKKVHLIEENAWNESETSPPTKANVFVPEPTSSVAQTKNGFVSRENSAHKVIEIKLHKNGRKNATHTKLFITTRFPEKIKPHKTESDYEDSKKPTRDDTRIDPKMDTLNSGVDNKTRNNESEAAPEINLKEQFLPKSLMEKSSEQIAEDLQELKERPTEIPGEGATLNGYPLEAIPAQQPRPNRQRLLTKPQRRSFYPYFFSRVLG